MKKKRRRRRRRVSGDGGREGGRKVGGRDEAVRNYQTTFQAAPAALARL